MVQNTQESQRIEAFIARWQGREGGQERANYALFLSELCGALGIAPPEPASAKTEENDYVFERLVKDPGFDGTVSSRRIDLYKKGCFVLEAKQSRQKGGKKEIVGQPELFSKDSLPHEEQPLRGRRSSGRAWDVLMLNARRQAEGYARALPVSHGWPPFILVCDVGHVIEIYADFSGQGKNYAQFPDRQSFRIYLEDLRQLEVRDRLVRIWTDPLSLDPALISSRVTRAIAERLAAVSKALENQQHPPEEVALFLMRCLFTMFAEDVALLPEKSFRQILERCEHDPTIFEPIVGQLWEAMDTGEFAHAIAARVRRFNGEFFKSRTVLPLGREEIGELRQAASYDWRDVDPSIFGTLLEQALDPRERRRLGAHYTPRSYVERLVVATVIEPLRDDWGQILSTAERQKVEGRPTDAVATVRAFHDKLCTTRILDPACGTGNFLYVSLELLKRLEGEVLEALVDLGGQEALAGLEGHTVDPHQFLGMEINPRAVAIAELVLWIGHLQWHLRTKGGMPAEPILRAFKNIVAKDAVLQADVSALRDNNKSKIVARTGPNGTPHETLIYSNPRRPEWPAAEFVVGNPPFIGAKYLRERLGASYTEALWAAHPHMNESADFVTYWWDRSAELLTMKNSTLRRFGLVTTNSITQVFQRRVIERHMKAKKPVSLLMAIPDHPWTKATPDAAAVRIAMTVAEAGVKEGILRKVTRETALDTDTPIVELSETRGIINSDLTVGVDITLARALKANEGLCSTGVKLHGAGFIITRKEADHLGLGRRPGLDRHIREYRNGRDLTVRPRDVMVIDLFGLDSADVRRRYPEVYQHLLLRVKPERDHNNRQSYRENWWIFGEPRLEFRPALCKLPRYIVAAVIATHRIFQFLESEILPDVRLVCFAVDDAYFLGVLSSRIHSVWALATGATLEDRPTYITSRCFEPFPFPVTTETQQSTIRTIAEDIDAHRKRVQRKHPDLTLTGMYNVLQKLRAGADASSLDADEGLILDSALVLILKELHDRLDAAVADAYGWPADLTEDEILSHVVALNKQRASEEAKSLVRWLRPEYQIPRYGSVKEKAELDLAGIAPGQQITAAKPFFPADDLAQTAAVMAVLAASAVPLDSISVAATFKQGRRSELKVRSVLSALTRTGFVGSRDGGRTFALRRTA
jgi:hypothetical protein